MYLEIDSVKNANEIISLIKSNYLVANLYITPPRSAASGNVGIEVELSKKEKTNFSDIRSELKNMDEHVLLVLESV